jgi:hypothetical protein
MPIRPPLGVITLGILTAIFKKVDDFRDSRDAQVDGHALCTAMFIAFGPYFVVTAKTSAQHLGRLFDLPDIMAPVKEVSYQNTDADREEGC